MASAPSTRLSGHPSIHRIGPSYHVVCRAVQPSICPSNVRTWTSTCVGSANAAPWLRTMRTKSSSSRVRKDPKLRLLVGLVWTLEREEGKESQGAVSNLSPRAES
jgi:hypothetical protein